MLAAFLIIILLDMGASALEAFRDVRDDSATPGTYLFLLYTSVMVGWAFYLLVEY